MNYDQIDVLDKGTVWQGSALDAAIDSPPFAGPLLVVCMDRGENDDEFVDHATVEAVLAVWIDDAPTGCLKDPERAVGHRTREDFLAERVLQEA